MIKEKKARHRERLRTEEKAKETPPPAEPAPVAALPPQTNHVASKQKTVVGASGAAPQPAYTGRYWWAPVMMLLCIRIQTGWNAVVLSCW